MMSIKTFLTRCCVVLLNLEHKAVDTKNHRKVEKMRECFQHLRKVEPEVKTEKHRK